jgi:23S rRNA (pseudouridine1915-N3)-methyltransferase
MRLRVIAVGTRMPAWVDAAVEDYSRRLRGAWRLELSALSPASRRQAGGAPVDERGAQFSTLELAQWLEARRSEGRDLAFVIGGPDGLSDEVLARGRLHWSLSRLTLPHALVRVVLAEQLYRASTVLAGHPYHRS